MKSFPRSNMKFLQFFIVFCTFSSVFCEIISANFKNRQKFIDNLNLRTEIDILPQIVGGQVAVLGQFPHHVLIVRRRLGIDTFCSGSLIRFNWVLTVNFNLKISNFIQFLTLPERIMRL